MHFQVWAQTHEISTRSRPLKGTEGEREFHTHELHLTSVTGCKNNKGEGPCL